MSATLELARPPITAEDFSELPETVTPCELIQGSIEMSPSPNRFHQDVSQNIEFLFFTYLSENPIGRMYHAPFDVYLDQHNVFQPDVAVFLRDNLEVLSKRGAEGAPDFVIEILSPSNRRNDVKIKRPLYERFGVQELWLVDPEIEEVHVYLATSGFTDPVTRFDETGEYESPMFPGLIFQGEKIFKKPN